MASVFLTNGIKYFRGDNDRLHIELERMSREPPPPPRDPYMSDRRGRSPEPVFNARSAVEIAELQDKLDKTTTELRRAQAELRLNQSDYDRSHVELEQMQEKVSWLVVFFRTLIAVFPRGHFSFFFFLFPIAYRLRSHREKSTDCEPSWRVPRLRTRTYRTNWKRCNRP